MEQHLHQVEEADQRKIGDLQKEVNQSKSLVEDDKKVIGDLRLSVNTTTTALSQSNQLLKKTKEEDTSRYLELTQQMEQLDKSTKT